MDDDQKELLKIGADAAFKPFASLAERLFGGAVDQIGGAWEDRLMVRRQVRRLNLFKKLKANLDQMGIEPREIPDRIWIPALQEALLQDDDTLHNLWAQLLANAADPRFNNKVLPSHVAILKELTPRQAALLSAIFHDASRRVPQPLSARAVPYDSVHLEILYGATHPGLGDTGFLVTLEVLKRHNLLTEKLEPKFLEANIMTKRTVFDSKYSLSELGVSLVVACQAPTAEANSEATSLNV